MKSFKGFAHIGVQVDNKAKVVAPVGELSGLSLTFTRDQTKFTNGATPGYMLRGFSYHVDDKLTDFPAVDANKILTVISWLYGKSNLGTLTTDPLSVKTAWTADQAATYDLKETGTMQLYATNKYIPSYIVFAPKNDAVTLWKIWFTNEAFFNQYDLYEYSHVKPLINLDDFFLDYVNLKPKIDAITMSSQIGNATLQRNNDPETAIRDDVFDWVDPIDRDKRIPVDWLSILWGEAGNNLDKLKESLAAWILLPANTKHTRDEWATIFPDIFTSTEIIFTPLWNEYGVAPRPRESGVYRGAGNMMVGIAAAKKVCKGVKYTATHIQNVANDCPTQFKSLRTVAVGGPENRDGLNQFILRHPDYLNVATTHVDFMRMTELSRGMVMMLMEMLQYAEEMTETSTMPIGYNRTIRDGVMYISKSYEKFLYLVVSKFSYNKLVGK